MELRERNPLNLTFAGVGFLARHHAVASFRLRNTVEFSSGNALGFVTMELAI
jgi:hypothetical protein